MKILIVNLDGLKAPVFPVGAEYNAEVLKGDGHDVRIVDLNQRAPHVYPDESFPELIFAVIRNLDRGPGNVESALPEAKQKIRELHDRYPHVPVAIVGAAVNALHELIRRYVGANFALATKGHRAVRALVEYVRSGGSGRQSFVNFTDHIKGVYHRAQIEKAAYSEHPIGVATHFGCPFHCQYCNYPAVEGAGIAHRDPDEVVGEIKCLVGQGIRRIFFCDSVFNVPARPAVALLRRIFESGLDVEWDGFINPHPGAFTEEFLDWSIATGRQRFHFGVDTLSEEIARRIHKGYSPKDVRHAVELCIRRGLPVSCSLLFGHPGESVETILESFGHIDEFGFESVDVTERVRIYPQTELAAIACKERLIAREPDALLFPTFFPVSDAVLQTVRNEAAKRACCVAPGLEQYIYRT